MLRPVQRKARPLRVAIVKDGKDPIELLERFQHLTFVISEELASISAGIDHSDHLEDRGERIGSVEIVGEFGDKPGTRLASDFSHLAGSVSGSGAVGPWCGEDALAKRTQP